MLIYDHHMGGFATRLLLFADAIQIIDTFILWIYKRFRSIWVDFIL